MKLPDEKKSKTLNTLGATVRTDKTAIKTVSARLSRFLSSKERNGVSRNRPMYISTYQTYCEKPSTFFTAVPKVIVPSVITLQ